MKQAERRKFHYIYKITRVDGKFYIGMHSTDDMDDGYFGSGQLLWKSIKKHGKEKHSKEVLEFLPSRRELKDRERILVDEVLLGNKLCMNLRLGGQGWESDEASLAAVAGNQSPKRDHKELARKSTLTKRERGTQSKGCASFGMHGRRHSSETLQKMSLSKSGEKNSQFGTCWICNDTSVINVKKEDLNAYLAAGYRRGRKQGYPSELES